MDGLSSRLSAYSLADDEPPSSDSQDVKPKPADTDDEELSSD